MMESHALGIKINDFFGEYFQNTTYIPSTGKAQAGILKVQGPPGNQSKTLSQRGQGGTSP